MEKFLERLNTYSSLTDEEKKTFRMLMTDFLPSGVDYKFKCEPLKFDLPKSFIEIWQKYPENPNPQANPIDSFNQWRSIEPLEDHINNPNLMSLHPRRYIF